MIDGAHELSVGDNSAGAKNQKEALNISKCLIPMDNEACPLEIS